MKSRIMMVAAMLCLLATACNKDEVTPQDDMTVKTPITINASYGNGNNGSKVQYTESGSTISATWQSGDQLLVIYNNNVNTLTLSTGAGTTNATFTGTISGTPSEGATLVCYVKDQNTSNGTITVNGDGSYIYTSDAFLGQDGTLASAAKLNLYCGWTRYSSTSNISCTFGVNTSMMKFTVTGISADAGETATIAYTSGGTEVAKATFTVAAGDNLIYLSIPAGQYTGVQSLIYSCGGTELSNSLSATQANFTAGQTYSKAIEYNYIYATPLTFEAKTAGSTVAFDIDGTTINLEYSKNGGSWTTYSGTVTLENVGDKVSFRGDNTNLNNKRFSCTGQTYIYGNIMSLISSTAFSTATTLTSDNAFTYLFASAPVYSHPSKSLVLPATTLTRSCYSYLFAGTNISSAPELPATTLAISCYNAMFSGCHSLTSAPSLPATVLAEGCYSCMFMNCTDLTSAPALPATTLAKNCYNGMFEYCSNLTSAPALPATTMAQGCYSLMFKNCNFTSAPTLPATTLAPSCYSSMFANCTNLTSAPVLPATTLANYCYYMMFESCTNLISAPTLPATTLANYCYMSMFASCTGLTSVPTILPATTLATGCYQGMFYNCTSLTTAPVLPATELVSNCYQGMFEGCSSLNNVTCLATSNLIFGPPSWLIGVAENGTFTKAASATNWRSGGDGIPSGWTVINQ